MHGGFLGFQRPPELECFVLLEVAAQPVERARKRRRDSAAAAARLVSFHDHILREHRAPRRQHHAPAITTCGVSRQHHTVQLDLAGPPSENTAARPSRIVLDVAVAHQQLATAQIDASTGFPHRAAPRHLGPREPDGGKDCKHAAPALRGLVVHDGSGAGVQGAFALNENPSAVHLGRASGNLDSGQGHAGSRRHDRSS
eukprot:1656895-Rhodomonas_salina.4